jgi:hypothetical protein
MQSALATGMRALTDEEWNFAYGVFRMASTAPALAGLSLLETDHHYLSSNIVATKAVESQVMSDMSNEARAIWNSDIPGIRDMVWHKAAHPVTATVLIDFALSVHTPERLTALGIASAAVRFPYVESSMKAAKAMLALESAIQPSLQLAGYQVSLRRLTDAMAAVTNLSAVRSAAVSATFEGTVYAGTRRQVVKALLEPVVSGAEPFVAWCAGYYKAVIEGASITNDSLMRSYSIRRLVKAHVVSYASGMEGYENLRKFTRLSIDKGGLPSVVLSYVTPAPVVAPTTAP